MAAVVILVEKVWCACWLCRPCRVLEMVTVFWGCVPSVASGSTMCRCCGAEACGGALPSASRTLHAQSGQSELRCLELVAERDGLVLVIVYSCQPKVEVRVTSGCAQEVVAELVHVTDRFTKWKDGQKVL
eukprot:1517178-Amphidinium_carterae.1